MSDCTTETLRHNGRVRRKRFVDWTRGIAVIGMVLWHTADGWLQPALRDGNRWSVLRFIGGFPAPCFLFLAGTGAALAARGDTRDRGLRHDLARGLEIMLLGYALRLQTWLLDGGGLLRLDLTRAWLPLVVGYLLLWRSLHAERGRAGKLALAGLITVLLGLVQVPYLAPGRLLRLLQVDVLQAIGASLVLLALAERGLRLLQRPWLAIGLGLGSALATAPVAPLLPGILPVPIAAYLGKFEVAAGQPTPALFPLLPWIAYACFGAALGTWLRVRADTDALVVRAGVFGAALALVTSEALPPVQHLIAIAPFSVHPLRVLFRIGLVLTLLLIGWLWATGTRGRLVETLGTASLRVYWTHLMVAYGALGTAWHKRLGIGAWSALVGLLLVAMWLLASIRRRAVPRTTSEAST